RPCLTRSRDRRLRARRARARPAAAARRRRDLRRARGDRRPRRRGPIRVATRGACRLRAGRRGAPLQRVRAAVGAGDLRAPLSAAVVVEGLRVVRGGVPVLDGLSLEVQAGSVTGLVGPSGGGKSTLMRAIVGVQRVAGGRIEGLGEPAGAEPLRRRVGYMTQAPSVYGDLSVRENLSYFARLHRVPAARIDELIEVVSLQGFEQRVVARL